MTRTIQPPLLAWAWSLAVGDPRLEPRLAEHHAWLREHRDLDGDGLLWLIQPDESGLDASPKYDHVWGPYAQGRRGFPWLIHHNRRRGFDARRIAADGRPVVCEVLTNVMWSLSRQASGEPSATPALIDRLWDEATGRFLDDARNPPGGAFARPGPLHLGHPRSPGASRPPGVDRPAPGRGDAALGPLPTGCTTAQRGARRSHAFRPRPLLGPAPLLARAVVDKRRVAGLAGAAPAGLRRRGDGHGGTAGRRRPARGPARVLPPAHRRRAWGPRTSAGRPWRWRWPSPSLTVFRHRICRSAVSAQPAAALGAAAVVDRDSEGLEVLGRDQRVARRAIGHDLGAEGAADAPLSPFPSARARAPPRPLSPPCGASCAPARPRARTPARRRPGSSPARPSSPGCGAGGRRPPASTALCPWASAWA